MQKNTQRRVMVFMLVTALLLSAVVPGGTVNAAKKTGIPGTEEMKKQNFVPIFLITGGTYQMGSPNKENWRTKDEKRHTDTVSDFYMSAYEVTQAEYKKL